MINVDEVEQKVCNAIRSVGECYRGRGSGNTAWTQLLKEKLGSAARELGYTSCASGCERPEWLFDVTWLSKPGKHVVDVPLVLESEWYRGGIEFDFDKLMLARAHLRVIVFESRHRDQSVEIIAKLQQRISQFGQSRAGDRYLFATWENVPEPSQFYFSLYVYG